MKWQDIAPVALSVVIVILIGVIERQSKTAAAITATMPLGVPLALWIVWAANRGDHGAVTEFSKGLVFGILPTMVFTVAAWLATRAGLKLAAVIGIGYAAWAVALGLISIARRYVPL